MSRKGKWLFWRYTVTLPVGDFIVPETIRLPRGRTKRRKKNIRIALGWPIPAYSVTSIGEMEAEATTSRLVLDEITQSAFAALRAVLAVCDKHYNDEFFLGPFAQKIRTVITSALRGQVE